MSKDTYIKKLERRIHNQRVALRQNWQIVEQRMNHRPTPLRSMWWDYIKKLIHTIKLLKEENKKLKSMVENGLDYEDLKDDITYPGSVE